jgi:mannose-1-phosphate guanylyltransferase
MKAFLMAAGKGTRLKPYTERHPKCLIPINGRPLLELWIDLLEYHGVNEVLINTHHHADQVETFLKSHQPKTKVGLNWVYESRLLGSAGTIWHNRNFVGGQKAFIIAYADNLTNLNLTKMIDFHSHISSMGGALTMGLMRAPDPKACGIATMDAKGKIVHFIEKPEHPASDLANSGVYIAGQRIFDIPRPSISAPNGVFDLGHDLLPNLVGRMYGFPIKDYLRDIGTPEAYQMALQEWSQIQ